MGLVVPWWGSLAALLTLKALILDCLMVLLLPRVAHWFTRGVFPLDLVVPLPTTRFPGPWLIIPFPCAVSPETALLCLCYGGSVKRERIHSR